MRNDNFFNVKLDLKLDFDVKLTDVEDVTEKFFVLKKNYSPEKHSLLGFGCMRERDICKCHACVCVTLKLSPGSIVNVTQSPESVTFANVESVTFANVTIEPGRGFNVTQTTQAFPSWTPFQ